MMITITIYSFIILYIIGRGFYISRKPLCNVQKKESFQNSISLSAMPFYSNMGSINLFAFAINFLLLSFISISLVPDLISNTVAYCQDSSSEVSDENSESNSEINHSDSENSSDSELDFTPGKLINELLLKLSNNKNNFNELKKIVDQQPEFKKNIYDNHCETTFSKKVKNIDNNLMELNKVSNIERPFLFNLNYPNVKINDPSNVLNGIAYEFKDIKSQYNFFIKEIFKEINKGSNSVGNMKYMYKNIHTKNLDMLYLTSNAYNKAILSSFTPCSDNLLSKIISINTDRDIIEEIGPIIRDFIGLGDYSKDVIYLSKEAKGLFSILENIGKISKENYEILNKEKNTSYINDEKLNIQLKFTNINIEEDIEFKKIERNKGVNEIHVFSNKIPLLISPENNLSIFSIQENINVFHNIVKGVSSELDIINCKAVEERGFILKEKNCYYLSDEEKSNSGSNDY